MRLQLDLVFTDIEIVKQISETNAVPLASFDSDNSLVAKDEERVCRLGTGSASGNQMKKPVVRSHLPGGTEFASFPASVDACLADPTPNPPTPLPSVVARVLDFADPAQGDGLAAMLKTCVAAFVTPTGNPVVDKKNASDFTGALLGFSLCRANGTLIPEDLIAQAVDPTNAPPVEAPPACH